MNYSEDVMRKMLIAWHPDWNPEKIHRYQGAQLTAIFLKEQNKFRPKQGGVSRDYMTAKLLDWNDNVSLDHYMAMPDFQLQAEYSRQRAEIVANIVAQYQ